MSRNNIVASTKNSVKSSEKKTGETWVELGQSEINKFGLIGSCLLRSPVQSGKTRLNPVKPSETQ